MVVVVVLVVGHQQIQAQGLLVLVKYYSTELVFCASNRSEPWEDAHIAVIRLEIKVVQIVRSIGGNNERSSTNN